MSGRAILGSKKMVCDVWVDEQMHDVQSQMDSTLASSKLLLRLNNAGLNFI